MSQRRSNPFIRAGSPSTGPPVAEGGMASRPRSVATSSLSSVATPASHSRNNSTSMMGGIGPGTGLGSRHQRNGSRGTASSSSTFAPSFIKAEDMRRSIDVVRGIEGENDFSGKRYVWLKDAQAAFVKGWVVEELDGGRILVQCDDGSQREVESESVDKVNPAKFDKANDMAELTHLNEASVVHNLHMRYQADLIYTYSGLFLVTVNPYCLLPIYTNEYINLYKGRNREDNKPHIYAMADEAFRNLVDEGENQSILVTGESGAGKTENTKKVIQYLAAVAHAESPVKGRAQHNNLSAQILRANPILEAFGNAQTVRNNNSSRFGKFIRIEFTPTGSIAGAFIDWYLLEKSRVVRINAQERNYHVFYQLLKGADERMKQDFMMQGMGVEDFTYTRDGHDTIMGVSDAEEWRALLEAFQVMAFSDKEQRAILRTVAAVLHLGNITLAKESRMADQARLSADAKEVAARVCKLLGIGLEAFLQGLLHPQVKAGREWVTKEQTPAQVRLGIDALAKGVYERGFGDLVGRINRQLDRSGMGMDDSRFIGVLDIAGFEIFEDNSFEQLCINYTNEKLQQFFNHHMFVLEQEEYAREQIEWKFIDFGRDLQPTIDLIELTNPIGIFSCLDEDSVMPKATDKSFTEKLNSLWDKKSSKYRPSRPGPKHGFILTHYAAEVEYSTQGWLEKNKDPLNDNISRLLAASTDPHIASLFADCADSDDDRGGARSRVKKGLFRTVAQRHKEQLSSLMAQLHSTHPHFVRCILPNHKKRPKQFDALLVLDQLRCNGVLEGIRIARTGFPNRLSFTEFRQRYEVLCRHMDKGYLDGQTAAALMLEILGIDKALYRVGLTKVFFRAGVLAELEEQRDGLITGIMTGFQSVARGYIQRRSAFKRLYRAEATRVIQRNLHVYRDLCENPWWQLVVKMKPLLGATRTATEVKRRDEKIRQLSDQMRQEAENRQRLEDERRNCHAELGRIQQTLESERALALDKEDIFKRLQLREAELEDKLSGAIDDQERLEEQLDALLDAKKRAEQEVDTYRAQLEQAAALIGRLEEEKGELESRASMLQSDLESLAQKQADRSAQEAALDDEVKMLQSQLSLKDRKVRDLEGKMLKVEQDADVKQAAAQKELKGLRAREQRLSHEKDEVQQQLSQLSKTSTDYEDLVRKKESELVLLRGDNKTLQMEQSTFEERRQRLAAEKDKTADRLREVQAEMVAVKSQQLQLQREAEDAKNLLQARLSEDAQAQQNRQVLECQMADLKAELYKVQMDLSRERQSRDDVALLAEHKFKALQQQHEEVKELKITVEKELYLQQDTLRRTMEARATAEKERDEARDEIRKLRVAKTRAEEARQMAEEAGERQASRAALEREGSLQRDLDASQERLKSVEAECQRLDGELQDLNRFMVESGDFGLKNDQAKERLERELVTVKGRLTASENDNRALLNKLQQKGLEIARSSSRAAEASRGQVLNLQRDKARVEEQNGQLNAQLGECQLTVAGLEKRVEKLQLSLEDLNHELSREAKSSRHAEKVSSQLSVQLAQANRSLESERQLRTQAQATARTLQATVDSRGQELEELRAQILRVLMAVDPDVFIPANQADGGHDKIMSRNFDMIRKIEELQQNLRIQTAGRLNAEAQLVEARAGRESSPMRPTLEEMSPNEAPFTPTRRRSKANGRKASNPSTPMRKPGHEADPVQDSARWEEKREAVSRQQGQDLASEVEELQNQLQLAQLQNRHLQQQLQRSTPSREMGPPDDSPSLRRVQKLEKANGRLHDMLDESAKKLSHLDKTLRSGELSLMDVQAKSHEELLDLVNSQERSRRSLLHSHNDTVAELTDVKEHLEKVRRDRASMEVELRDARSDLEDMTVSREQEAASRSQLLQETTDLHIRLDAEASKLADVVASLDTYKSRAEEYFAKLEQAEIAVLKANRAEEFAKSQAREAEDQCAEMMTQHNKSEDGLHDLQRQKQRLEEKLEDVVADLDAATQAKKRLQHELEDYRNQRAIDVEDKESSMEQMRKKYQAEFATLTKELDASREEKLYKQSEITRLRDELEELRSKWDDEVLNSSTWSKEKSRMEATVSDVVASRDEAVKAHNDAQGKVVSLLSQVRSLRTSMEDMTAERDSLMREKRGLEARLEEARAGLDDLAKSESPALRRAASTDKTILDLKSDLAQQQDMAAAAVEKMRRADSLATELQKEMAAEREASAELSQQKATLEKTLSELQLRLVDLETKGYSSPSQDIKFLHKRIQELESHIEARETEQSRSLRSVRKVDRTVRDLQSQVERKEKLAGQLAEDAGRLRDRVEKLLRTIDDLQASESSNELAARRAERELRAERDRSARLERELAAWKSLRMEKGSVNLPRFGGRGGSPARSVGGWDEAGSAAGTAIGSTAASGTGTEVPKRKSSIGRAPSLTKGFL